MSRTPARFTQADIARAIRAIDQAGARCALEISPDGTIRIVPLDLQKPVEPAEPRPLEEDREIRL